MLPCGYPGKRTYHNQCRGDGGRDPKDQPKELRRWVHLCCWQWSGYFNPGGFVLSGIQDSCSTALCSFRYVLLLHLFWLILFNGTGSKKSMPSIERWCGCGEARTSLAVVKPPPSSLSFPVFLFFLNFFNNCPNMHLHYPGLSITKQFKIFWTSRSLLKV